MDMNQLYLFQLVETTTGMRTDPVVLSMVEMAKKLSEFMNGEESDLPDVEKAMVLILGKVSDKNEVEYSILPLMYTERFVALVNATVKENENA